MDILGFLTLLELYCDVWFYGCVDTRGEDTRTNFTDHLKEALVRKGIRTFIDRELVRGEEISPALVKAIEESRISLIVFSENYASSRWCLDELVKILQCKQSKQQVVLPIFYKLDPSDVRKQTSKFGDAFEGLIESKFKDNEEKVLIWREALTKTANLSGHTFKDGEYETTFINSIVDGILSQVLSRTYWNVAKYPVGIQSRVQDVERHLDVGGNGRRMVGIWGTSGIGKTTIAKAIWNAIAYEFEGSCFLENVRENSMTHGGLIKLQETLLHKILGGEWKIYSIDEGIGVIKESLSHKKILLILDDVNQLKQLDNLAGVGWFGEGSRVITTTQDSGLLKCHGIDLIYEVQKLYGNRALELFSFSAFDSLSTSPSPLDVIQSGLVALMFINSSALCSSCATSCILEFAKVQSFKQINASIVFGLNLALFSDTTLPPALKIYSDATVEAGTVSKSRAIRETIGYNDLLPFHQPKRLN
ncbi:TMV resistance protein N-like [Prunus avium]|uniref:TMV resistance protein N-like n=1 Tax=Prunus avium TaxID=42229 RepID=A0A6P5RX38_PRUAV|nr:TMV resistance protein N-like [Prunus avium]